MGGGCHAGLSVGCCSSGHLPHVDNIQAEVLKAVGNIFCWRVWGKVTDNCL
jgi:hypothetical protein